jgi:O-antigen/teichoic acid export membrane protein
MVYLQALKKINEMAQIQIAIKLISFLVIVLSSWKWGFPGFIFSTIVAYFVGLFPLLKQMGIGFYRALQTAIPSGFNDMALFSVLGMGITALGQYGDIFILDRFTPDRTAMGYYALALIFLNAATQITGTVQSIVTPYFSERSLDKKWIQTQIIQNQKRMIALSLLVAVGVFGLAWILITFLYGSSYQSTLFYLVILLLKYIVWSAYAVIGAAFVGLGLIRYGFFLTIIYTPVSLLLTYSLLQQAGVIGVAWAQVGAALFNLILILATGKFVLKRYFDRQANHLTQPA